MISLAIFDLIDARITWGEWQISVHQNSIPDSFDDKCQGMGPNSVKFNSFLGTSASSASILPPKKSDWKRYCQV